jgi:MoaA/NifB/PqqE/SkfB family radical SAM enzyme
MLIIIKDFVNMHLFVEILRRCMILCVSALYKKRKKRKEKREGKKKSYLLALSGLEDIQGGCFPD